MGRAANQEPHNDRATPEGAARERVLRYLRLAGYGREGQRIRIHAVADHGTHWYFTFAVASLEDPTRDFLFAGIVAEKETGFLFAFPSRARQPIDPTNLASLRLGCTQITPDDLARLEAENEQPR